MSPLGSLWLTEIDMGICILMELLARRCCSKQEHWEFYWVYFLHSCLRWAEALGAAVGTFWLVAIDGLVL